MPAWAWLVAIVAASFAVRAWLARGMVGPFIMVDELIYSELGRSLADSGELLVRDVPSSGYGFVYPALISPAYAAFERLTDAYAAVKTLNALVMSLAAVPAYLLARRVVGRGLSLLAAVLAVSLPSLVYTGSVMTENAFYPVFLVCALLLTLVLERPTSGRQVVLLIAVGVAAATRVQAVVLVPALLTAPLLFALLRRESLRMALSPVPSALRRRRSEQERSCSSPSLRAGGRSPISSVRTASWASPTTSWAKYFGTRSTTLPSWISISASYRSRRRSCS